jgi:hypothetical protein
MSMPVSVGERNGIRCYIDFVTTGEAFQVLTEKLARGKSSYVFAELNDLLTAAAGDQVESLPAPAIGDPYAANYVAAMVELAAHIRGVYPPDWTTGIAPLPEPVFAVPWLSLRAHLLTESPVPFRRRNIFIDSSLGARV